MRSVHSSADAPRRTLAVLPFHPLQDINDFLTNELKAKELHNAQLEMHVAALEKEKEDAVNGLERELEQLRLHDEAEIAELTSTVDKYKTKLNDLKEFQDKKGELERALEEAKRELDEERIQSEERVSDLERKHVQEKDRLKKEMALRIKETKANMMRLTDNQLETTTKRTIMENEQISSELAYQSKQTESMLHLNERLRREVATMRRDAELYKQTEGELAKRNHVYQKTVKTLLGRVKEGEAALREEREAHALLEEHATSLEQQMQQMRAQAAEMGRSADAAMADAEAARGELGAARGAQDEVTRFLTACLGDLKARVVRAEGEGEGAGVPAGSLDDLDAEQREVALTYLLDKLAAAQGLVEQPSAAWAPEGATVGLLSGSPSQLFGGAAAAVAGAPRAMQALGMGAATGSLQHFSAMVLPPVTTTSDGSGILGPRGGALAAVQAAGASGHDAISANPGANPLWPFASDSPTTVPGGAALGARRVECASMGTQTVGVTALDRATLRAAFNTGHDLRPWGKKAASMGSMGSGGARAKYGL